MRMKWKNTASKPSVSQLLGLVLVLALVLSVATIPFSGFLNNHLSRLKHSPSFAEDQLHTAELSNQVAAEGAVLLENQENTLPLDPKTNVALFGLASIRPVYSDGRSDNGSLADSLTDAGFTLNEDLLDVYRNQKGNQEPTASAYSAELLKDVRKQADVAIIALSHTADQSFLLTETEQDLLQLVADLHFDQCIVLINSATIMQLDFLQEETYGIDAALWIGAPGAQGMEAVGELLSGVRNPSGKTTATYAYEFASGPAASISDETTSTISYTEGIYVGYRYYETRYANNEKAYDAAVQYPFGYGLSYTTFDQQISGFSFDGTQVSVEVTVTNTGDLEGATVAELYARPPYTDQGLETSSTVLVGYAKTNTLAPQASETITISFPLESMASYDKEAGHFVLKQGNYQIQLQSDAHTTLDTRGLNLSQDFTYEDTTADFSGAEVAKVLSRSDWKNLPPEEEDKTQDATAGDLSTPESTDTQGGVKLRQLQDAAYDDPAWSTLLNSLSEQQLDALTTFDGFTLPVVGSIGLSTLRFLDGCYGLTGTAHGVHYDGTLLPCMSLIGSTWDDTLVKDLGAALGQEAQDMGLSGVYCLSGALLRNPDVGDACSEDPILTGSLLCAYGAGVESSGTMCLIQDYGIPASGESAVLLDEQALRELYLRPFALCLKSGSVSGVCTSEGTLGKEPVGASPALLRDVLRTEWDFTGLVISTSNPAQALTAGASLVISEEDGDALSGEVPTEAAHHTLYTVAQHRPGGSKYGPKATWRTVLTVADVILIGLNLAWFWYQKKHPKENKE